MKHRTVTTFVFACLLTSPGCDPTSNGDNSEDPRGLDRHQHLVVMHIRTINHASDELGTVSVIGNSGILLARRDGGEELTRTSASLGQLPKPLQLVYPDSEVHTCSTHIEHFVGYMSLYGGDTMRYGELDRYGPWEVRINPGLLAAAFAARDSASVYVTHVDRTPDTVRSGGILELDVTVDLDGLLVWEPTQSRYTMRTDRVHVTQR